jgi:hypothetical protein
MPVKFRILPSSASLYKPLTSRFLQISMLASTKVSTKLFSPMIAFAMFLSSSNGEINEAITMVPASLNSLQISATRLMFSLLSSWEKLKSLLMPIRVLSPSKTYDLNPKLCKQLSNSEAMLDLPEADKPVSQIVNDLFPFNFFSLTSCDFSRLLE